MLLDQIPGYREAVEAAEMEEESLRDFAYTGWPESICGAEVKQFTPRHFLLLCSIKSPFLCGGDPSPEDVGLFLWVVSPEFKPFDLEARARFLESIITLPYAESVQEIRAYIDRARFDRPSGGSGSTAVASFFASLVHVFASEYGWSRDQVLDSPMAALYQELRMIIRDHDPRRPFPNRISDAVKQSVINKHLKALKKKK
jgi:hypothetical protein